MSKVASKETEKTAKKIWFGNNLEDRLFWRQEIWNNNEFDPIWGYVEHDGYRFSTNENSDYIYYNAPTGEYGEFLRYEKAN